MYMHTNLKDTQDGESWWSYRKYTEKNLLDLDHYLQQVPRDVGLHDNLFENMEKLCKALGLNLHPTFAYPASYLFKAYPNVQNTINFFRKSIREILKKRKVLATRKE